MSHPPGEEGPVHLPVIPEATDPQPAQTEAAPEAMSTYAYNQLVQGINAAREAVFKEARDLGVRDDLEQQSGIDKVAEAMAQIIADDDPHFDRDHFRKATGILPLAVEERNETGWTGR